MQEKLKLRLIWLVTGVIAREPGELSADEAHAMHINLALLLKHED